jgi:hypothetical protein
MSNRWWDAFIIYWHQFIASFLPEGTKRQVLYELCERVMKDRGSQDLGEMWNVDFEAMYSKLKD